MRRTLRVSRSPTQRLEKRGSARLNPPPAISAGCSLERGSSSSCRGAADPATGRLFLSLFTINFVVLRGPMVLIPSKLDHVVVFAIVLLILECGVSALSQPSPATQDWTHYVRIAAWSLHSKDNAPRIVREAQESHVLGIEIDNDITGRYESFLHPEEKLAAIRAVAEQAHKAGNHAFVYIAGLECITANAHQI